MVLESIETHTVELFSGSYETPASLASYITKMVLDSLFQTKRNTLKKNIKNSHIINYLKNYFDVKICDPMVGSGIFLKETINFLIQERRWVIDFLKRKNFYDFQTISPVVYSEKNELFTEFIIKSCLYGVDSNTKNIEKTKKILSSNFKLRSSIHYNLQTGNAVTAPLNKNFYDEIFTKNKHLLIELISKRKNITNIKRDSNNFDCEVIKDKLLSIAKSNLKELVTKSIVDDTLFWPIEFPEIFFNDKGLWLNNTGFDIVIGNPPWKSLKPDDRKFFNYFFNNYSYHSRNDRDIIKEKLLKDTKILKHYLEYKEGIKSYVRYLKTNIYNFQGKGETNLYKISLERFYQLCKHNGKVGIIIPVGISIDKGSAQLRNMLFSKCRLKYIIGFEPKSKFFDGADICPSICFFSKGGKTDDFNYANSFRQIADIKLKALPKVSLDLIRKTSPVTLSIPSIVNEYDIQILNKLYSYPILSEFIKGSWNIEFSRELDETNDRYIFRSYDTGIPLIKGTNIKLFKISKKPFIWVDPFSFEKYSSDSNHSRIVWRDIARPNLKKRMIAAWVPPHVALGNSLNYIRPSISESLKYYILAFLNSTILEYRIRQLTANSHINIFLVKQLPIPRLSENDPIFRTISKITQLICENKVEESTAFFLNELDNIIYKIFNLDINEVQYLKTKLK